VGKAASPRASPRSTRSRRARASSSPATTRWSRPARGKALTRGGTRALAALAKRGVLAVLSGHVHDAFDIEQPTEHGPVRMIGAGTLSQRLRATPAASTS
jgi:hypothetical protein